MRAAADPRQKLPVAALHRQDRGVVAVLAGDGEEDRVPVGEHLRPVVEPLPRLQVRFRQSPRLAPVLGDALQAVPGPCRGEDDRPVRTPAGPSRRVGHEGQLLRTAADE